MAIHNMTRVMSKARKNYPASPTKYFVACTGVSKAGYSGITIFEEGRDGVVKQGTTFALGDTAEYGSYNLSYTGEIVKITDKCVTIVCYPGSKMSRKHMLSVEEFCWRNKSFNAAETARRNSEEMMYL